MTVGFDILLWFFDEPVVEIDVLREDNNFVDLTEFAGKSEPTVIRVLGLRPHKTAATEATEINGIVVEHPYNYLRLFLDLHPQSVKDEAAMNKLSFVSSMMQKQYKYIALRGDDISENLEYKLAYNDFPKDKALLFSKDGEPGWSFDYRNARRVFTVPIRSYFSIEV